MLEVMLLGQFEVLHDGQRLVIPTRNAQSLLANLLLNAGKSQRRERLAGLLWPDSSEDNARSNLRHELWRLRKALQPAGEDYLLVDDLSIAFNPQSEFSLDVHKLESAALEAGNIEKLMQALSFYRGELLPGFYDEWVFVERQRLHALFEKHMLRLLELLQAEGRWAEVLDWGMRWISLGQWPEPAYRALMTAYANSGDISKAVTTYERFKQGLLEELGSRPSEETQSVYKRIKAGWKVPAPPQSEQSNASARVMLPPSGSLPRVRRSNLPKPLTSFVGREKEIQQVERLVLGARLVTITGTGGMGKTRLAIQAAGVLAPKFRDGAWWVELASLSPILATIPGSNNTQPNPGALSGAELVAQAITKALHVPEAPDLSVLEGLVEYLYEKQLVLILDNCEHLVAACAELVQQVLSDCPQVSILATSREPLGVPGEKVWYLPSLTLPENGGAHKLANITQSEAARLFIERTADIQPGYQPSEAESQAIAQICLSLDGIPLAIELAAARMSLLSAREIAARLDSRFQLLTAGYRTMLPRHQTLQAAIEWSYELLSQAEQTLLRRLSVFAGSFTLEAAEIVCAGEGIQREQVLTLLGRLVDKSLLQAGLHADSGSHDADLATRFRLLDTICSFGHMKLEEAGEVELIRSRHADYYVYLVETAEPELVLSMQGRWYRLLRAEQDNLRSVVEWSVESGHAESALRLMGALTWSWWSHGSVHEGLDLALKALTLPAGEFERHYARALNTAAWLQWVMGDISAAREKVEEALSILRKLNDKASLSWALQFLGMVLTSEGQYETADAVMQEAVAIAQKTGDLSKSSFALAFLGDISMQRGDHSKAMSIYHESAHVLSTWGNKLFEAYPLRRLGYLALERGEFGPASDYFWRSLKFNQEGDDRGGAAACLIGFAVLALHLDMPVIAARLLGAAECQIETFTFSLLYLDQAELKLLRGRLKAALDEDAFRTALEEGWQMSEEQVLELVDLLTGDRS